MNRIFIAVLTTLLSLSLSACSPNASTKAKEPAVSSVGEVSSPIQTNDEEHDFEKIISGAYQHIHYEKHRLLFDNNAMYGDSYEQERLESVLQIGQDIPEGLYYLLPTNVHGCEWELKRDGRYLNIQGSQQDTFVELHLKDGDFFFGAGIDLYPAGYNDKSNIDINPDFEEVSLGN